MILNGDCIEVLKTLREESVDCCVTSPPYYNLRDYGVEGQIGLEKTPAEYISKLVLVFREVKRVLKDDGTLWVNIADSYAGSGKGAAHYMESFKQGTNKGSVDQKNLQRAYVGNGIKQKDLIGIPWMLAFALRADGWYLRQDIIWHKPNPMPESVTDRCTKSHEYIFLLSKSKKYYYNNERIKEQCVQGDNNIRDRDNTKLNNCPGRTRMGGLTRNDYKYRNKRDVWTVSTKPYKGAHFATFPPDLIEPCVLAGCPVGGTVLDCFFGSGTVGVVATANQRNFIGIDLNKDYCQMANERIANVQIKTKKEEL